MTFFNTIEEWTNTTPATGSTMNLPLQKLLANTLDLQSTIGGLAAVYLGIAAKAADSDKLDNHDSTYFIDTSATAQTKSGSCKFGLAKVGTWAFSTAWCRFGHYSFDDGTTTYAGYLQYLDGNTLLTSKFQRFSSTEGSDFESATNSTAALRIGSGPKRWNASGEETFDSAQIPSTDNAVSLGKSGARMSAIWAANGTIQTSDYRAKNSIQDSVLGLSFVEALRPVSYKFNLGQNLITHEHYDVEIEDEDGEVTIEDRVRTFVTPIPGKRTHFGFIAQEVKVALGDVDCGAHIITDTSNPDSEQGLRYEELIAPMVKAIQELSAKVKSLEAQLAG